MARPLPCYNFGMAEELRGVTWEAYEHHHVEKKSDWYWVVGILVIACALGAILLGNVLLGIAIFTGGAVMLILAAREPKIVSYAVTQRGLRIDQQLFPYSTLEAYHIDEENVLGPQLLVMSEKMFMPLLVIPVPEEYTDDIEDIIGAKLPEQHLEEPFGHKMLEFIGF